MYHIVIKNPYRNFSSTINILNEDALKFHLNFINRNPYSWNFHEDADYYIATDNLNTDETIIKLHKSFPRNLLKELFA
jgi:hypothetical protein